MDLIKVNNLCVGSRLTDVSISLESGAVLGLIGPNGAGKSTLLNAIIGLEDSSGDIYLQNKPIDSYTKKQRARIIGLQPQTINSVWSLTVKDVVALGRMPWGDENEQAILEAMQKACVTEFAARRVNELSGGERARVWLARVLAGQPEVILADEPISSLDIHYQVEVMELLADFAKENKGVIVAIHDLSLAARYCDKVCLLNEGSVIAMGEVEQVLTKDLLSASYGIDVDVDLTRQPPIVLPA